jgi:hypothetical protein
VVFLRRDANYDLLGRTDNGLQVVYAGFILPNMSTTIVTEIEIEIEIEIVHNMQT